MNKVALNLSFKVREKDLHSSFQSNFILSRSGQVVNMSLFPKLDLETHMCHEHEINLTMPIPGGVERTKTRVWLGPNRIKIAPVVANSTSK